MYRIAHFYIIFRSTTDQFNLCGNTSYCQVFLESYPNFRILELPHFRTLYLIQGFAVSEQPDDDDRYQKDAQREKMSGEVHEVRAAQYDAADNDQEMS